jgi:hypothetical protein
VRYSTQSPDLAGPGKLLQPVRCLSWATHLVAQLYEMAAPGVLLDT